MTRCLFCAIYTNRRENVRTDAEHGKEKMHKNICFNKSAPPTGNLDSRTSQDVLGLLKVTSSKLKQTIVMITHNEEIAQLADRRIRIEDGKIVEGRWR